MVVVLVSRYDNFMIGNQRFDADVIYPAFVMVIVRRFQDNSKTMDFIAEPFKFFYPFMHCLFNCCGMINTTKYNLSITNHRCASCTPFSAISYETSSLAKLVL